MAPQLIEIGLSNLSHVKLFFALCVVCLVHTMKRNLFVQMDSMIGRIHHVPYRDMKHQRLLCDLTFKQRVKHENSLDQSFKINAENEITYWRKVLRRIVEVIKFLSSRGLAFRDNNQILGSKQNGNFLGIIELVSKFDPFLEAHLSRYGNKGKGLFSKTTVGWTNISWY